MTNQEINAISTELQVGDRIFYTGDMANQPAFGRIVGRVEDPKWGLSYNIEFADEDQRWQSRGIRPASFQASPGQRFKTLLQYEAERRAAMAQFANSRG
jgi:hypothetical protein